MTQEEKDLLLKDLSARLPYQPLCKKVDTEDDFCECDGLLGYSLCDLVNNKIIIKPYLRPMSSMTEEEARDIAILHGNESVDILSIKVADEYMDIILDDGVCGTYTETIWYNEIISSIDCFDYLNKNMFDFRGLIPKDLALSTEIYNPYKTSHL